jgi:resuscitation-promoting factor RpfB
VSSGGRFRGAYQFNQATWDLVARQHFPHLVGVDPAAASPADQDSVALALYRERGASPWPRCGSALT